MEPKVIKYPLDYKYFCNEKNRFTEFEKKIVITIIGHHHWPFMNKSLSKTIMVATNVTTKLRNTLLKIRYEVNKKSYIKATISNEIICVSFL